jgi:hypothetical protein
MGKRLGEYRIITQLEIGFGNVYLAIKKSAGGPHYKEKVFAMKITQNFRKNVELEVFQPTVGHPYVLQLVAFFKTKVGNRQVTPSTGKKSLL